MKTLITGAFALDDQTKALFEKQGLEITFHKDERSQVEHPEEYEAVVCNGLFLYNPIEQFTSLKIVQLTSAGYDRMSIEYAKAHGIQVYNAKGVYSVPMAEFAIGGILALYKQSKFFFENQKNHRWDKHRGLLELYGKKVCIVGCGDVGTEIAKRLQVFGCQIAGVNRTVREDPAFRDIRPLQELKHVVGESDIVVLSIGLTNETAELVKAVIPSKMRKGSILVNMARGGLVDTEELVEALQTERLAGAVLDVFEEEPLSENSLLWDFENVILTPHNSFVGEGNRKRLTHVIVMNLSKGLK